MHATLTEKKLSLSQYYFSDAKTQEDSDAFYECITDQPTERSTDTAYHRYARTHLKNPGTLNLSLKAVRIEDREDG